MITKLSTNKLFVSVINLGEVFCRTGRVRGEGRAAGMLDDIDRLALAILPATNGPNVEALSRSPKSC